MEAFLAMPLVDRVLGQGESKTSVVTPRGIQIDVRVVAPHQLGAALLYFTGSKAHNVKLRQRALARGYTLNEYALTALDGGKVIASETEEEIYAALGLPFIPPVLREDAGEIEAAEHGTLPKPLGNVTGDFHLHSDVSGDAHSPLEELVESAIKRGYKAMAVTDHAEGTVAGVAREKFLDQRAKIRALQAKLGDAFRLLHGVELNIGPEGQLDYDDEFRRGFDWCLASVHDNMHLDRAAQTKRIVTAMKDPSVRMIGHPTTRMIGGRPPIDLDMDAILTTAEQTGTALEINGALPRLDLPTEWLRRAAGRDLTFVLDSDAHKTEELDRVRYAKLNAERAGLDPARVINAGEPARLLSWLASKKKASS
jgi:DNA polymerase (family 10)